jgi:hypothetical protein
VSYNKEQCCGEEEHNLVSIAMHEKGMTVQQAMDFVGAQFSKTAALFLELEDHWKNEWSDGLRIYVKGMGNWVTATYEWSFLSLRYGLKEEMLTTRVVQLFPRRK